MSWTTPSGITSCCCTNQCPQCGACCAIGCSHRGTARVVVTDHTLPPFPMPAITADGEDLTELPSFGEPSLEDRIRQIVREELETTMERFAGALIKGLER